MTELDKNNKQELERLRAELADTESKRQQLLVRLCRFKRTHAGKDV
jgi:hypothetical protein